MSEYVPTIGLEIHAELKTQTKMFCSSKNDTHEDRPNVNICPVCMAHPGTLPVINKEAVKSVLKVGAAIHGTFADYTEFDRKNYFYPDLPKGYQLSQYEFPLISGGTLNGVAITRIHLEEDTASSIHNENSGETLIDYNRAGTPLMELVTEPVIHSAKDAADFGKELQLLLQYLDVSDANMEKGEMRLEANVSVSNNGTLGTKVEIKNLNSFGIMERAVAYEIKRQITALESGEEIVQETRGWNDARQETFSQRVKEGSADYRYFPDPDLPSLKLSELPELTIDVIKASLPELPEDRRQRYVSLGVKMADAIQFVAYPKLAQYFDAVIGSSTDALLIQRCANYIANDVMGILRDTNNRDTEMQPEISISASAFRDLMIAIGDGKISARSAKDVLIEAMKDGSDPLKLAETQGLLGSVDESALRDTIEKVIADNPVVADDYRKGKVVALQFLIGQAMKALRGKADPSILKAKIMEKLSE